MVFSDSEPPKESKEKAFPVLDKVVTVDNCWYYLSLLERFVQITKDMDNDTLKMYLVRAEYRYNLWISASDWFAKDFYLPSIAHLIVPKDVAFFLQAHMLSPLRFYDDIVRVLENRYYFDRPELRLKEIHNQRSTYREWDTRMHPEPFDLAQDILSKETKTCAALFCIACSVKMEVEWTDYVEWRTDHTVALQCHRCDAMFTVKHRGKYNWSLKTQPYASAVPGMNIDENGYTNPDMKKELYDLISKLNIRDTPFNQGLEPIRDKIQKTQDQYFKSRGEEANAALRNELVDAIRSTYYCTPYSNNSIDLIQAVARQYKFAYKVTTLIKWDTASIVKGIRQYSSFLNLIKKSPKLTAVPTIEIDLAWHTHMLHPYQYKSFTERYIGKFVNHDDTIPEDQLKKHVNSTSEAWKNLVASRNQDYIESLKMKKKLKRVFVSKKNPKVYIDGRLYNNEEKAFQGSYNSGSYDPSPEYDPTHHHHHHHHKKDTNKVVGPTSEDEYDDEKISFHDKREVRDFVTLNHSDEIMDKTFAKVKQSPYGFIGTSNCGNTDSLNQCTNTDKAQSKDTSGYTKVVPSHGDKPKFSSTGVEALPAQLREKYEESLPFSAKDDRSREIRPNSAGGDDFNWSIVTNAWLTSTWARDPVQQTNAGGSGSGCGGGGGDGGGGDAACGSGCGGGGDGGGGNAACGSGCGAGGCGGGCGGGD